MKTEIGIVNKTFFALSLISGLSMMSIAGADMSFSKNSKKEGGLVGNGGGTIVCRDLNHQIKRVELLDFYESMLHPGMKIDIQSISGDWKSKATAIIERIHAKSEMRFQLYSRWLNNFESERQLLNDVQMSTVTDSGYIGVPSGCAFEQAAIQKKPIFSGDARYFLNAELWNAMDESQKAGLVIHELIYREAIGYGHTDSIRTRYLTALYSSEGFANQTLINYWKTLDQAHFELVDVKLNPELKGTVNSWLSTKRLWQAAPDEKDVPGSIKLEDEVLLSLGKCSGVGCSVFESRYATIEAFANTSSTQIPMYYVNLPKDLSEMNIGETSFVAGGSIQIGFLNPNEFTLEDVQLMLSKGTENNFILRFLSKPKIGFSLIASKGRMAFDVASVSLIRKPGHAWEWSNVTAGGILDRTAQTNANSFFGIKLASASGGQCMLPTVEFENNEISSVWAGRVPFNWSVERVCNEKIQIWDRLANGSATFLTDSYEPSRFDPLHPGRLLKKPASFFSWVTPVAEITCNLQNCLTPTLSFDFNLTAVILNDQSAQVEFSCDDDEPHSGPITVLQFRCKNRVKVKAQSRIEFYPNGVPKGFLVGESALLIVPNQSPVLVQAGNFVELDTEGNVRAIQ